MAFCERLSEQLAVVARIPPQAGASTAVTSDAFSMALHRRALFVLQTGAGTSGNTVAIQENNGLWTAGTASILTAAAIAVDVANSEYLFEVAAEAMGPGMIELQAVITAVGTDLISMVVMADVERYHPGSDRNLASTTIMGVAN